MPVSESSTIFKEPAQQIASHLVSPYQFGKRILHGPSVPFLISVWLTVCSSIILCGWIFQIHLLIEPLIGLINIKANTALGFVFSGLSCSFFLTGHHRLAKISALIVATIGSLSLFENLTGYNLGIDQILALDSYAVNGLPGRMAQHTSIGFTAVGFCIIFGNRRLFSTTLIEAAGYLVCLLGITSLIGYAYEVPALYHSNAQATLPTTLPAVLRGFTGVSLTTSILFIALGANLLALKKEYLFRSIWTSNSHGGELLRTFVPLFISLPIIFGFSKTYLENAGIVDTEVAFAIIVTAMVVVTVVVMTRLAARFDKIDVERVKNETQKQDLLYALAHDMKIPLIGSDKMLELIITEQVAEAEVRNAYLLMVKQSNASLLWMIQNLIFENQRERGLELTSRRPTNLVTLISKCVDQIQLFAISKELVVHTDLTTDLTVDMDAEAIKLVLINVLHNALKFTNKGSISVATRHVNDEVIIEISDTGIGISPDKQGIIFERIWQSEENKRESTGGTGGGLGLHLCRHIMNAHGGEITYKSRLGGGSVFSLSLPCESTNIHRMDNQKLN